MTGELLNTREALPRKQDVYIPVFFARQFVKLLERKRGEHLAPHAIQKVEINTETEARAPDGLYDTISPILLKETNDFYGDGLYLIPHAGGIPYYLIELKYEYRCSSGYLDNFVGITQVPSPHQSDLAKWGDEVISKRVKPSFDGHCPNPFPGILIHGNGLFTLKVELYGEDFNLEDFYKLLTTGAAPRSTT